MKNTSNKRFGLTNAPTYWEVCRKCRCREGVKRKCLIKKIGHILQTFLFIQWSGFLFLLVFFELFVQVTTTRATRFLFHSVFTQFGCNVRLIHFP